MRTWRRRAATGLLAVGAIALLGACGSDDGDDTGAAGGGETVAATGKSLCAAPLVKIGAAIPSLELLEQVAAANGLSYVEKVANGDFNAAIDNIQSCARDSKTAAVVTIATENGAVKQAIDSAEKAGTPVFSEYSGEPVPGQTFAIAMDEENASQQLVDYAAENIGEELEYLMVTAKPLPTVRQRVSTFEAAASAHPGWTLADSVEVDLTDPANGTAKKLEAALRANPDVTMIVTPWDDPAAGAVAAVRQAGNDDIKVLTYDGVETTWAQMRAGNSPIVAVAGQPTVAISGMLNRQLGLVLDGGEPESSYVLCRGPLVTADNLPAENEPLGGGSCDVDGEEIPAEDLEI